MKKINVKNVIKPIKKTIIRWNDQLLENKRSERIKLEKKLNTLNQNVIQNQIFYQDQLKPKDLNFLTNNNTNTITNTNTNNNIIKNNNKFIFDVDKEEKMNYDPKLLQMTKEEKDYMNIPMEEEIIKPNKDINKQIKEDLEKFKDLKIDSSDDLFNDLFNYLKSYAKKESLMVLNNKTEEQIKDILIKNKKPIIEKYWNNNYNGLYEKQLSEYNNRLGEKSRKDNLYLQQAYKSYYNRISNLNNLPFSVAKLPDETDENYYNRMSNIKDYRLSQKQILNNLQEEYKQKLKQYLYENTNLSLAERVINHEFFKDVSNVKIIVDTIKNFDKKLKDKYSQIDFDTFMLFCKNYVNNIDGNNDDIEEKQIKKEDLEKFINTNYKQFNIELLDELKEDKYLNHFDEIDKKNLLGRIDELKKDIIKASYNGIKGLITEKAHNGYNTRYNSIRKDINKYILKKKGKSHEYRPIEEVKTDIPIKTEVLEKMVDDKMEKKKEGRHPN